MNDWVHLDELDNNNKIETIYKYKNSITKISKYDLSNISKISTNQKQYYINFYNNLFNDNISLITKIGYCIFFNIKNTNNINTSDNTILNGKVNFFNNIFKKTFYRLMVFKNKNDFLNKSLKNISLKLFLIWNHNCFKFIRVRNYIKQTYLINNNQKNNFYDYYKINYNKLLNKNTKQNIMNILNKCIISYNIFNPKFNRIECIKNIYNSSAGIEGWYNYYNIFIHYYFDIWKKK